MPFLFDRRRFPNKMKIRSESVWEAVTSRDRERLVWLESSFISIIRFSLFLSTLLVIPLLQSSHFRRRKRTRNSREQHQRSQWSMESKELTVLRVREQERERFPWNLWMNAGYPFFDRKRRHIISTVVFCRHCQLLQSFASSYSSPILFSQL
jgi:hypothetical protein